MSGKKVRKKILWEYNRVVLFSVHTVHRFKDPKFRIVARGVSKKSEIQKIERTQIIKTGFMNLEINSRWFLS